MPTVDPVEIPNRSLFRPPEGCEIAKVQPYVLRSWEAEFPDLGVAKTAGGARVYRRTAAAERRSAGRQWRRGGAVGGRGAARRRRARADPGGEARPARAVGDAR